MNFYAYDADYETKEAQWDEIKKEILGEYADLMLKARVEEQDNQDGDDAQQQMLQAGVPIATSGQTINYAKVSGHIFFYNESLIVKSLFV